jgi:HEAT repeat protein
VKKAPPPTPQELELFREAGLEATTAAAEGKDPSAAASRLARNHQPVIVRLLGNALSRGGESDLLAANRIATNLFDKGARLIDVFLRVKPRNDKLLERCAKLVGEIGGKESLDRLRNLLKDPAPPVRVAAFEGLAKGLDADALGKLAREVIVDREDDADVRTAAVEALGAARAIGQSALCAKVIHDGNPDVRKAATRSLTRMGPAAVPGILEDVRARGQEAIGGVVDSVRAIMGGDPTSAPPEVLDDVRKLLLPGLRDKDSWAVRWAAAIGIGSIGKADDLPALDDAVTFEKHELAKANMEMARAELRKRV